MNVTVTDPRAIDGWVEAANRAGITPEAMALELLQEQGIRYADLFKIGVITSAAFVRRFSVSEYAGILAAAEESPDVAGWIGELTEAPLVVLTDARIGPRLLMLTEAGLLAEGRAEEIQAWVRPGGTEVIV